MTIITVRACPVPSVMATTLPTYLTAPLWYTDTLPLISQMIQVGKARYSS